jgi:hypothetical protein
MSSFLQDDVMDAVLDQIWGGGAGAGYPVTYYVALMTTTPDPDGTGGVEATYTDYARFAVTNDATEFPGAVAGVKTNANEWDFGVAGSGPTTIHSVAFLDHPTDPVSATTLWASVDVTGGSLVINNGADVKVQAGALDLTRCL